MPLDPFQGQEVYAGEVPQPPLPMRMMENAPGIATGIAFNAKRGANTIMSGGGFMDDARMFKNRRATRFGAFRKGSTALDAADINSGKSLIQYGSRQRSATNAAGQMRDPWLRGARANNITARPRAFSRMTSLSGFSDAGSGTYSYAGGIRGMGKARFGPLGKMAESLNVGPDEALLGPGLFSSISAGRRTDRLERKVLAGGRGTKQLTKVDRSIQRLMAMNAPELTSPAFATQANIPMLGKMTRGETLSSVMRTNAVKAGGGVGTVGTRGDLLASAMPGKGTQFLGGFTRGAAGYGESTIGIANTGYLRAVQRTTEALGEGITAKTGAKLFGQEGAKTLLSREGGGIVSKLGVRGALEFGGTSAGAKILGTRALYGASRAVPVLGQAMLAYDLARMSGEIVKSGINLARDAEKSLQGSFSKPTFGMGYRDTEAAATSRSRGVMAIQNSRLNARSALGSEAGMMSAHFG